MSTSQKAQLGRFGRAFALLLNRSLMYEAKHPYIKQSVAELLAVALPLLETISPLVFILNRGQFYIDEEMLDPRINVNRTAAIFKGSGLQSISFENGLLETELMIFTELFGSLTKTSSVDMVKEDLIQRGVFNIKLNHVVFKKVTEHDQVVSREALKNATPFMDSEDPEHRKQFMETLMESVLSEELASTLNINNLMANPRAFTQQMIEADLVGARQFEQSIVAESPKGLAGEAGTSDNANVTANGTWVVNPPSNEPVTPSSAADASGNTAAPLDQSGFKEEDCDTLAIAQTHSFEQIGSEANSASAPYAGQEKAHTEARAAVSALGAVQGTAHGVLLLQQIEVMHVEVDKHLQGQGDISLSDLTHSIFEMKNQLLENIQAQKALGIAYANESAIVAAADKLTDKVLIELIKEEYQAVGAATPQRLAHLIVRLIPEANDLKRLLPQIKRALLQQGMKPSEYFNLIQALRENLQGEELTRILQESSEAIGLDGDMLVEEVKRNPAQAAELIYLASELRKSGADESALSDVLVDYVERLGNKMATAAGEAEGPDHLKQVISDVESTLLRKLSGMNVNETLLKRMEERLNARMESIMDNMRVQWLQNPSGPVVHEKARILTVLQTLENNVTHDEDLSPILKALREKADAGAIEENNFSQILEEIIREQQLQKAKQDDHENLEGVLTSDEVMFILEKEIARAKRYGTPISALAFAFVKAKPELASLQKVITSEAILDAALKKLSDAFRTADYVGRIGKNKIIALLPMAYPNESKNTLTRVMRLLHAKPLNVHGVPVHLRVAGISAAYDAEKTLDAKTFVKHLSQQLADMVTRIKSIQVLF